MIQHRRQPFAHTFSIVARDPVTGQMGVAVQSHWFSVGSVVPWAQAGIGAIATQSLTDISYGPLGLDLLRGGKTASQTLDALMMADDNKEVRQVAIVDAKGNVATHTGKRCIVDTGHVQGVGFSVQANMMINDTIPAAMAKAYAKASDDPSLDLCERMLAALDAAQAAGGDIRGKQSAAIKIVGPELTSKIWGGVIMELRVEDHPEPLQELRRLVEIQKAYEYMNQGDDFLAKGESEQAKTAYEKAAKLAPQIVELPFWNAVSLADTGHLDDALPIFKTVFDREPIWADLVERLVPAGLIKDDPAMLAKILAQAK
jgi:uncharacterized Ntn-hydrolase superfamily protein